MKSPKLEPTGSGVEERRPLSRRSVWFGIVCLSIASGVALSLWAIGLPLAWTADYDTAKHARIARAIAADPQHFRGRRLHDVGRELGLEDVPWDDGDVQNLPGSYRIYHFRGFALYVTLDYMRDGLTQDMLLDRGSPEEKLRGRDLLRIHPHIPPFARIDGIGSREERMRQFWARVEESIREINEGMESERRKRLDQ